MLETIALDSEVNDAISLAARDRRFASLIFTHNPTQILAPKTPSHVDFLKVPEDSRILFFTEYSNSS